MAQPDNSMKLRIRLIGEAKILFDNTERKYDEQFSANIDPFAIQIGDLVTHPLLPDRALVCRGRRIDLVARQVVVLLDLLESPPRPTADGNVVPLKSRC